MLDSAKSRQSVPPKTDETRLADGTERLATGGLSSALSYRENHGVVALLFVVIVFIAGLFLALWWLADAADKFPHGR